VVAALFLSLALAALLVGMRGSAASPVPVLPPNCTPPGVTVISDASGDQTPPGTTKHDMQSISIAEPDFGVGVNKLVFTMKVADLNGALPANTQWKVYFTSNAINYWVAMQTDGNSVVSYKYGTSANQLDTTVGDLDAGSFTTNGAITLTVSNNKVGNPAAGQNLTTVFGECYMLVGIVLAEIDFTSQGTYTLVGNAACAGGSPSPLRLRHRHLQVHRRLSQRRRFCIFMAIPTTAAVARLRHALARRPPTLPSARVRS
jgi:hypothetical protein